MESEQEMDGAFSIPVFSFFIKVYLKLSIIQ